MELDLRRLRYFASVAAHGGFSRAAEAIGVSQPPLSQQIAKLEAEIGAPLFERDRHGASLTPAGAALLAEARIIFAQTDRAVRAARAAAKGEAGALSVGLTDDNFRGDVMEALAVFHKSHPGARVASEVSDSRTLTKLVEDERLDLAVVSQSAPSQAARSSGAGLASKALPALELVAVLPKNHPLAAHREVDLAALADDPFIFIPTSEWTGLGAQAGRLFDRAGFSPNVIHETFSTDAIISLVAAGAGVSLVTRNIAELFAGAVAVLALKGGARVSRAVLWRKDDDRALLKNFLGLLSDRAAARR